MTKVILVLGSNLGARRAFLSSARRRIARWPKSRVLKISPVLETQPELYAKQNIFLNQALELETALAPMALLIWAKLTEIQTGRRARFRNGPREIDIDLISYGTLKMETPLLTLPHPRKNSSPAIRACLRLLRRK